MNEGIEGVHSPRRARRGVGIGFALPSIVAFVLAACQQGGAPPPEPNQAPAIPASAEPAPPADSAGAPAEASSAAGSEAPPAPGAPSAPPEPAGTTASASASPVKAPKPAVSSHTASPPASAESTTAAPADATLVADACTTKNFHYTQIGSACRSGGRKKVKDIMKGAVKKAKAAGTDLKCTSCHEDTSNFHLKSNAVSDLKQWL
jgi:hypothetical protein